MLRWLRLAVTALAIGAGMIGPVAATTTAIAKGPADSRFGLDFVNPPNAVAAPARLDQASALGVGWDRFPMYWSSMQPTAGGPIDFSATDALVAADLARGFAIDAILVGAPSWASSGDSVDLGAWSTFVDQTVTHYQGKVHAWEIWNEPDMLNGQGQGLYWTGSVAAYYQLLKAGYLAVKSADPSSTVILGGIAFPYNNQDFFPKLMAEEAKDPTSGANHGYFDVLAFHSYDRVDRTYELPIGYLGSPGFAGFLPLLHAAGLNPPIWANELGVPIWDEGTGQDAPGRATRDEQAAYLVEAIADGLAAGVSKFFVFQLYDDGAGAIDPRTNQPAEFFGLVNNSGMRRPSFGAYQNLISQLSGVQAATHLTLGRGSYLATPARGSGPPGTPVPGNPSGGSTSGNAPPATPTPGSPTPGAAPPGTPILATLPQGTPTPGTTPSVSPTPGTVPQATPSPGPTVSGTPTPEKPPRVTRKGVEVVTMYGVSGGRMTIAWNDDPGAPVSINLPSSVPTATLLDKFGQTIGQVTATNGTVSLTLPGATNNNNFDCFTPHGCDPNDYIIGGNPVILVENDPRVPAALFDPLPLDSLAPIHLSWHGTGPLPAGATYDVQYRDATDGIWHDWLAGTTATSAQFGDGSMLLQGDHSYEFRLRVHDASGNLVGGQDYPSQPLASSVVIGGNVQRQDAPLDAKIEVVWPHGNLPVGQATKANLTAEMFAHGTTTSVNPNFAGTVTLWQAVNNGVGQPVATGSKRMVSAGGLTYPVWDFNDVDVSAARGAINKEYFWLTVSGRSVNSTVWAHGADSRTNFPQPDTPTAILPASPPAVDAKIEVVWPQGNLPVGQATKANISVQLFGHGTSQSVPLGFGAPVRLYRAIDNGVLEPLGIGDRVVQTRNGITFPTWQFNDVDVSAARDPSHRITFWVEVAGVTSYSNVWVHGVDARTNLPQPDVPTAVGP